jgi:hypothetical protein
MWEKQVRLSVSRLFTTISGFLLAVASHLRETFNVIYATAGFLTYQIASLAQGLYNDE